MNIDGYTIGSGRTFVIAEVGSNHLGSLDLAYEHIDAAAESGADAVKFQSINLEKLYKDPSQSIREMHAIIDMDESWCADLKDYAEQREILFSSSPTYLDAVDMLNRLDVSFFKLASAQVGTFPQLVQEIASTCKPTILSSGIANYGQLSEAISLFSQAGNLDYAVMHCNSLYPTPVDKVFLGRMETYRKMFNCPVGFSDHTKGSAVVLAAVALGAEIIEKHFFLGNDISSPDAPISVDPDTFKTMANDIRTIECARGDSPRLELELEEQSFKDAIRYRLCLRSYKSAGEYFTPSDFDYLRNSEGIDVGHETLVCEAFAAAKSLKAGSLLQWSDVHGIK